MCCLSKIFKDCSTENTPTAFNGKRLNDAEPDSLGNRYCVAKLDHQFPPPPPS